MLHEEFPGEVPEGRSCSGPVGGGLSGVPGSGAEVPVAVRLPCGPRLVRRRRPRGVEFEPFVFAAGLGEGRAG